MHTKSTVAPTQGVASPAAAQVPMEALRAQLRRLLDRSPFYQRKWASLIDTAAQVDSFREGADLARLPLTTKDELRVSQLEEEPIGLHLCVPLEDALRISSTSGTTGRPLYYALTHEDKLGVWQSWKRVYEACGLTHGDRTIFGLTMGGPYGALYGAEALEWSGHSTIPAGSQVSSARFIQLLQHLRPTVVISITNFPLRLAAQLREAGIDPRTLGVKKFLVAGEPVRAVRALIEQEWNAIVYDMMGIGEGGMLWAECEYREGMHFVGGEIVHMEYLDPETLMPAELKAGTVAELVFTHLHRQACPLVRYRTHDLVRVVATQCACGRGGPRIEPIGRSDDMIKVRGANVFPSAVEALLVSFGAPVSEHFRILLPNGERKFSTPLRLVVGLREPLARPETSAVQARLESFLRDHLNVRVEVSFAAAAELAATLKGPMERRTYFLDEKL